MKKKKLSGVPETMLQTVYARAKESNGEVRHHSRRKSGGTHPKSWTMIPSRAAMQNSPGA